MIRFNFLPWRDAERRRKKNAFHRLLMLNGLLGVTMVLLVWVVNQSQLNVQSERRAQLNQQMGALDRQIREVANLKRDIDALQARQRAVENLQANRHQPVRLLQMLSEQVPNGIMLKSLKQDDHILLSGYALSNGRVSELLRQLDYRHTHFGVAAPELLEIKSSSYGDGKEVRKLFEFTLAISMTNSRASATPAESRH